MRLGAPRKPAQSTRFDTELNQRIVSFETTTSFSGSGQRIAALSAYPKELAGGSPDAGSKRELFRRRIAMLLSANPTVVFFGCFEQLEMTISGRRSASLTERLHLLRRHRFETARNSHVLTEN